MVKKPKTKQEERAEKVEDWLKKARRGQSIILEDEASPEVAVTKITRQVEKL